ncbi:hypothetical protein DN752_16350 [Echinicola strongylocentroti]|uniref:Murein L,D-transpeptidase catalytic domain family protein n=1 Tax=Echinicola strongylocentroti TaxID=1795355 RepID=A0A2Z4ILG4_9BACT|nr:murein L,D-transpeptidase catalytic domain family protein [Echinicola strongylocentroti]AWW31569.1 hypothetical protein DN752_16350 [Echinicola strongylocentroti]
MLRKTGLMLALLLSTGLFAYTPQQNITLQPIASTANTAAEILIQKVRNHLDGMKAKTTISPKALEMGINGFLKLSAKGSVSPDKPLTIIDFSLPSSQKRLWTVDPITGKILHHTYVAHGRNSGGLMAKKFSNTHSSYMSSLGFYRTAETYSGKHGYSLRLDGIEKGVNDQARQRAIVIHGAEYANPEFIKKYGRLGRSLGCPALPMNQYKAIIDSIKEDGCLFIYAPPLITPRQAPYLTRT